MTAEITEWQCTCGKWVPIGWSRHPHFWAAEAASFEQLHAMRRAQEAGLSRIVPDALAGAQPVTYVLRAKDMPTR